MKIKYISYNYGSGPGKGEDTGLIVKLHLIRFTNGQGKLFTTKQMKDMKFCK